MKLNESPLANDGATRAFRTTGLARVHLTAFGDLGGGTLALQCFESQNGTYIDFYSLGEPAVLTAPDGSKVDSMIAKLPGGFIWRMKLTGATSPDSVFVHVDGGGFELCAA